MFYATDMLQMQIAFILMKYIIFVNRAGRYGQNNYHNIFFHINQYQ